MLQRSEPKPQRRSNRIFHLRPSAPRGEGFRLESDPIAPLILARKGDDE